MGPYCKFCNNRCFAPTDKGLKATCKKGIEFDLLVDKLNEIKNDKRKDAEYIRLKSVYVPYLEREISALKNTWV